MPAKTCINYYHVLEGLERRGAVVRLILIWTQIVLFLAFHSLSFQFQVTIHQAISLNIFKICFLLSYLPKTYVRGILSDPKRKICEALSHQAPPKNVPRITPLQRLILQDSCTMQPMPLSLNPPHILGAFFIRSSQPNGSSHPKSRGPCVRSSSMRVSVTLTRACPLSTPA